MQNGYRFLSKFTCVLLLFHYADVSAQAEAPEVKPEPAAEAADVPVPESKPVPAAPVSPAAAAPASGVTITLITPVPVKQRKLEVKVAFGQAMDQAASPRVSFGQSEPYSTYPVTGSWQGPQLWQGSSTFEASLVDGQYTLIVSSAKASDGKTIEPKQTVSFLVDTQVPALDQVIISEPTPANFTKVKVVCVFSESMDTTKAYQISFGEKAPFKQYPFKGGWAGSRQWVGEFPLNRVVDQTPVFGLSLGTAADLNGNQLTPAAGRTFTVSPFYPYYAAVSYYQDKKYDLALNELERFMNLNAQYGDAYVYRGKICQVQGNENGALEAFKQALALDPLNEEAYFLVGSINKAKGNIPEADRVLASALRLQARQTDLAPLGKTAKDAFADLIVDCIPDQREKVGVNDFHFNLGNLQLQNNQWPQALEQFQQLVKAAPESHLARFNLGTMNLYLNRLADAEKELYQALNLKDDFVPAHINLGIVFSRRDSVDAALREFGLGAKNEAYALAARANAGIALVRKGNIAEGMRTLVSLQEGNQDQPWLAYNLAVLYGNVQSPADHKKARKLLGTVLAAGLHDPRVYCQLGRCYQASGELDSAVVMYLQALQGEPLFADACYRLGLVYQERGWLINSQLWLQRAINLDGDFADAHARLGMVYGMLGMKEKELAAYEKASALRRRQLKRVKLDNAKVVAVTSFDNTSKNQEYTWLQIGIAEALCSDLKVLASVRLVERFRVEKMMQEKMLAATDLVAAKATGAGKELGAQAIVTGGFQITGGELKIDARVVDAAKGTVLGAASVQGPVKGLFDLQRRLGLSLVKDLGVEVSATEQQALAAQEGRSLEALKYLSEGRQSYYQGDLEKSLAQMRKAVELNSAYMDELSDMDLVSDEEKKQKTLAVLEFGNSSGDSKYDWMQSGIAEALVTDLKKVTGLYLVERMDLRKAMDEINLGMTDIVDEGTAPQIGKMVGAGVVLVGGYQVVKDNVRIDGRMIDVESGGILMGESVQGPLDKIFELEEHLAFKIADMLNVAVSMAEREQIVRKANPTFNALRSIAIAQASLADQEMAAGALELAVLRFKNTTAEGAKRYDYLQAGILEALTGEFRKSGKARIVDQRIVEAQVGNAGLVRLAGLGDIEQDLTIRIPADFMVQGQYRVTGDQLAIESRIVDTDNADILCSQAVAGTKENALAMEQDLARKLLVAFDQNLQQNTSQGSAASGRGRIPYWWGGSLTGVGALFMGYYIYQFGVANDRYQTTTPVQTEDYYNYWSQARNGYYQKRNFFIGLTITAAVATGGTWVWNEFVRPRFFKNEQPKKEDAKMALKPSVTEKTLTIKD